MYFFVIINHTFENMKRSLYFVLMLVCLISCKTSKNAQEFRNSSEDVWQTMVIKQIDCQIDDNLITVKYNNGTALSYVILDDFGHVALTWDHIGRKSFDDGASGYKGEIDIPSFVTSGEHGEFLFQVIQIDENAFFGCNKVTSINIPFSIGVIRQNAFKGCSSLSKITVNHLNMTYKDVDGVLYSKDNKMLIQYPISREGAEFQLPYEVTLICPDAFRDNRNLTKITMGNDVAVVSDYAFKGCKNLKEMYLGRKVIILGVEAFKDCPNLSYIYAPGIFPPHNCPTVFDTEVKETCKVTVPKGQKVNYSRHLEWNEFKNMSEEW